MSVDEIRKLAEDCKETSEHYKNMTPCSDAEKEKWYMDASKMEADKAAALLAYAAMVERCDWQKSHLDGLLAGKDYKLTGITLRQVVDTEKSIVDYILHGDAGKEGR